MLLLVVYSLYDNYYNVLICAFSYFVLKQMKDDRVKGYVFTALCEMIETIPKY